MPFVYQDGMLEPQEITEEMPQIGQELNEASVKRHGFVVMTDTFDDPVIFRIDTITKVTVNP